MNQIEAMTMRTVVIVHEPMAKVGSQFGAPLELHIQHGKSLCGLFIGSPPMKFCRRRDHAGEHGREFILFGGYAFEAWAAQLPAVRGDGRFVRNTLR